MQNNNCKDESSCSTADRKPAGFLVVNSASFQADILSLDVTACLLKVLSKSSSVWLALDAPYFPKIQTQINQANSDACPQHLRTEIF